ncbi:MAG: hypothetical protein GXO12_05250 [Epsilonproteobacteria bacterium]|nr:hypothetical protein [Campylobacterota bacterium]
MALTPVEGAIYVNQNMQIAASKQIDLKNRIDLQNSASAQIVNDKEKEVEEVRPAEEAYKIDPEKDHERDKSDQSTGEKEEESKLKKQMQEKEEQKDKPHLLDIKV